MHFVIVAGRAGSGKTVALHALEDLGFYCVDNLPLNLLEQFLGLTKQYSRLAIGIDGRNVTDHLEELQKQIKILQQQGHSYSIIFLSARDDVLVKRYSETRRRHPLSSDKVTLLEAISLEKDYLADLEQLSHKLIDTSELSQHELSSLIRDNFVNDQGSKLENKSGQLQILLQSFGFKSGLPANSDYVFDVRCIPNPYWVADLRPLTGLDKPVQDYLNKIPMFEKMVDQISNFLLPWIEQFRMDNRSYLTISIGCTGGCHRSVYCVQRVAAEITKKLDAAVVQVRHLHLKK